jgi:hypothetical protein
MVCVCPSYDNSHGRQDDDKPSTFGSNLFLLMLSPPMAKIWCNHTWLYNEDCYEEYLYPPKRLWAKPIYTWYIFIVPFFLGWTSSYTTYFRVCQSATDWIHTQSCLLFKSMGHYWTTFVYSLQVYSVLECLLGCLFETSFVCVFVCFILQSAVSSHRLDSVGRLFFVKFWIPIVCQVEKQTSGRPSPKKIVFHCCFPSNVIHFLVSS